MKASLPSPLFYTQGIHGTFVLGNWPVLILGAGRIVGAPSDWLKRSRDCDVGDPSFRTVFQQEL